MPTDAQKAAIAQRYGLLKAVPITKALADLGLPQPQQTKPGFDLAYNLNLYNITATDPATQYAQAKQQILERGAEVVAVPKPKRTTPFQQIVGGIERLVSLGSVGGTVSGLAQGLSQQSVPVTQPQTIERISPMGLFDTTSIQGNTGIFGSGVSFSDLFNVGTNLATQFLRPPTSTPVYQTGPTPSSFPVMASVPAVIGAGRSVATVGRSLFTRYPNLATAIQQMRQSGRRVSRSQLYSALRRFGPTALTGIGLSAAAVSELAVAGPGRRRMNPANHKALRRAARRIKSFHKLCRTVDLLHSRGRVHHRR